MPLRNFSDAKVCKDVKMPIRIEIKPNNKCYTTQLMNNNYKNVV